jgi:hypothetical protein
MKLSANFEDQSIPQLGLFLVRNTGDRFSPNRLANTPERSQDDELCTPNGDQADQLNGRFWQLAQGGASHARNALGRAAVCCQPRRRQLDRREPSLQLCHLIAHSSMLAIRSSTALSLRCCAPSAALVWAASRRRSRQLSSVGLINFEPNYPGRCHRELAEAAARPPPFPISQPQ